MSSPACTPATRIYIPEIPADSQEIGTYTAEIAAYIAEIGTYMKEIAGCSLETRIAFMEATPDWSEIATRTPKIAGNSAETAVRSLEMTVSGWPKAGNQQEISRLRPFYIQPDLPRTARLYAAANVTSRACA